MIDNIKNCVVQVSSKEKFSGTGFFISHKGYIVTCHHVIYSLDEILVTYKGKRVEAKWCKQYSNIDADLAVLKIDETFFDNIEIVRIVNPINFSSQKALLYGFPSKKREQNPNGFSYDSVTIRYSEDVSLKSFFKSSKLNINRWSKMPNENSTYSSIRIDNIEVDSGASGGLVYVEELEGVVGVIQAKDTKENYTNAIRWENFFDVLSPKDILDLGLKVSNELDTSLLKKTLNRQYPNTSFQELAYKTLLKESHKILPKVTEEIIDELVAIEDIDNPKNIPILCFAKQIYKRNNDVDIVKWIKYAESYYKVKDLACEERELTDNYNILIEISLANKDLKEGTVQIWANEVCAKGKEVYTSADFDKKIDLTKTSSIIEFVDMLFNYLKRFQNPDKVLLEFILPKELLNEDIKLWMDSKGVRINDVYATVFRFQERFVNYAEYKSVWESHWENTYKAKKLDKIKSHTSCLKIIEDGANINRYTRRDNACITAKFPIVDINGSLIYKHGISIVLSPRSFDTVDKLEEFNLWFEESFKCICIENIVDEVNRLFTNHHKDFKSNIILIWDNPNRVPQKYKETIEHEFDEF